MDIESKPGPAMDLKLPRRFLFPRSWTTIVLWVGLFILAVGQQSGVIQSQTPSPVQQVSAAAGLAAAYGFSEASGTTTADSSGNNNTGTLVGGVTRITAGKYG